MFEIDLEILHKCGHRILYSFRINDKWGMRGISLSRASRFIQSTDFRDEWCKCVTDENCPYCKGKLYHTVLYRSILDEGANETSYWGRDSKVEINYSRI